MAFLMLLQLAPQLAAPATAIPQGRLDPLFDDRSAARGVLVRDCCGAWSMKMGAGAAWFDFDADGDDDLLVLQSGGANTLLRHDGSTFADVSGGAGVATPGDRDPLAVSTADVDQDGLPDAYVATTAANQLLRNSGGGTFVDVASAWRVTGGSAFSSTVSWADFDRDGDLDLYVGNYVRELHFPYHVGEPNLLFENRMEGITPGFRERAKALGVSNEGVFGPSDPDFPQYVSPEGQPTAGLTLSVSTLDLDEDGYPDILVGNDFGMWVLPNAYFHNTTSAGALSFEDSSSATAFDSRPQYNMGVSPVDFDHDGDWDLYLSNLGDNVFLRNDGGVFVDAAFELGPVEGSAPGGLELLTSWATVWADVDNDTWEDLVVVNGFIPAAPFLANAMRQANALWMNRSGTAFTRMPDPLSGLGDGGPGRGVGTSDVDGDGLLDLYTTTNRDTATVLFEDASRLWLNAGGEAGKNGWVELRLRGRLSNPDGIGARLQARVGATVLRRQVLADTVYLSSSSKQVHLGLGGEERIEELAIHWPSGVSQGLLRIPAGTRASIREPALTVASLEPPRLLGEGVLRLAATVDNHTALPVAGQALFLIETAAGGAPVPIASTVGTVPPGEHPVAIDVTFPAGLAPLPERMNLLLLVSTSDARDERILAFDLP